MVNVNDVNGEKRQKHVIGKDRGKKKLSPCVMPQPSIAKNAYKDAALCFEPCMHVMSCSYIYFTVMRK